MRFEGQTAVVTGAGTGIGYAIVRRLAREGARVLLNDLDPGRAESAAAAIDAEVGGGRVSAFACDVADVATVRQMIEEVRARTGRLDIVVANAGLTLFGSFLDFTPADFDRVMGVNMRGTFFTAQAGARAMIAGGGGGRVVLLSSVNGYRGMPNLSAYAATKAGIIAMARNLGAELGPHGITVNAVAPGATITERTLAEDPQYEQSWSAVCPTRRACTVEDIAGVVAFLCSAEARQVNGQTLLVDGGWTNLGPLPPRYQEGEVG